MKNTKTFKTGGLVLVRDHKDSKWITKIFLFSKLDKHFVVDKTMWNRSSKDEDEIEEIIDDIAMDITQYRYIKKIDNEHIKRITKLNQLILKRDRLQEEIFKLQTQ